MDIYSYKVKKLTIALACDFFHPSFGGVESHIYQLAQCLLLRGHRVIVITHSYGKASQRQGVRYMARGLKVYYVPFRTFYKQVVFVTVFGLLPVFRDIFIREGVDIIHGHSAFSSLAVEALLHGKALGLPGVFTDHSLFGFADLSSILANKVLHLLLNNLDNFICVSHVAKENLVLRGCMRPDQVFVIPNAIDSTTFTPDPSARSPNNVTVIVMSRLVYRKGADLLAVIIPPLCSTFPNLNFIIGGDGEKRLVLQEMCERHNLHSRVQLLGTVPQNQVRDVLVKGDIFLNTSLTESFCIAIVEAASCGLLVVSTAVGGVPEVLPPSLIRLAPVSASGLATTLAETIEEVQQQRFSYTREMNSLSEKAVHNQASIVPQVTSIGCVQIQDPASTDLPFSVNDVFWKRHRDVRDFYTWQDVAERTEMVYLTAMSAPRGSSKGGIVRAFQTLGPVSGKIMAIVWTIEWILIILLEWIRPSKNVERVPFFTHFQKKEIL